jgi:hypothetical protein
VGTYKRWDAHPTKPNRLFNSYVHGQEVWLRPEALDRQRRRCCEYGLNKQAEARGDNPKITLSRTGRPVGFWSFKDPHPTKDNRFFWTYRIGEEIWVKGEHFITNNLRSDARRRKVIETKLTAEDREVVNNFYKYCDRLNRIFGKAKFHVDHVKPISMGGTHDPSNLQVVPAKWNMRKGNRSSERWVA